MFSIVGNLERVTQSPDKENDKEKEKDVDKEPELENKSPEPIDETKSKNDDYKLPDPVPELPEQLDSQQTPKPHVDPEDVFDVEHQHSDRHGHDLPYDFFFMVLASLAVLFGLLRITSTGVKAKM